MNRDAKKIVERFADALAAAAVFSPEDLRQAVQCILSPGFSMNDDERAVATVFADFLDKRAARKERALREAFGERKVS